MALSLVSVLCIHKLCKAFASLAFEFVFGVAPHEKLLASVFFGYWVKHFPMRWYIYFCLTAEKDNNRHVLAEQCLNKSVIKFDHIRNSLSFNEIKKLFSDRLTLKECSISLSRYQCNLIYHTVCFSTEEDGAFSVTSMKKESSTYFCCPWSNKKTVKFPCLVSKVDQVKVILGDVVFDCCAASMLGFMNLVVCPGNHNFCCGSVFVILTDAIPTSPE